MVYMGLDLSLRGAAAVVVDEHGTVVDWGLWGENLERGCPIEDRIDRLLDIATGIVKLGKKYSDDLSVGIEDYAYGLKGMQNDLGEIQGVIKTQIRLAFRVYPSIIVASAARKMVLGKGRFSKGKKGKKEIIDAVRGRGFRVNDDNVADAYVIAECLRMKRQSEETSA